MSLLAECPRCRVVSRVEGPGAWRCSGCNRGFAVAPGTVWERPGANPLLAFFPTLLSILFRPRAFFESFAPAGSPVRVIVYATVSMLLAGASASLIFLAAEHVVHGTWVAIVDNPQIEQRLGIEVTMPSVLEVIVGGSVSLAAGGLMQAAVWSALLHLGAGVTGKDRTRRSFATTFRAGTYVVGTFLWVPQLGHALGIPAFLIAKTAGSVTAGVILYLICVVAGTAMQWMWLLYTSGAAISGAHDRQIGNGIGSAAVALVVMVLAMAVLMGCMFGLSVVLMIKMATEAV